MRTVRPRHSKDEFARLGDLAYEREVLPRIKRRDEGKFVAIDIETGTYEIDVDEMVACDRLRERVPTAQVWLRRIGSRFVRRFGPRPNGTSR